MGLIADGYLHQFDVKMTISEKLIVLVMEYGRINNLTNYLTVQRHNPSCNNIAF